MRKKSFGNSSVLPLNEIGIEKTKQKYFWKMENQYEIEKKLSSASSGHFKYKWKDKYLQKGWEFFPYIFICFAILINDNIY